MAQKKKNAISATISATKIPIESLWWDKAAHLSSNLAGFCDSFFFVDWLPDFPKPRKKKRPKTWAKQHKSWAVWIFWAANVSFCLKTKKSTRQLFNFSLSKRWSKKNSSPTLDTVCCHSGRPGQSKCRTLPWYHTPTHPTQDASSSPPGLNYITTFLGDREFPYKPLCATLTGRGVDPIYFSIYLFFPGMQLTFPFEILWLPTGKKRSFGFRNENHHTDVGSKLKKKRNGSLEKTIPQIYGPWYPNLGL